MIPVLECWRKTCFKRLFHVLYRQQMSQLVFQSPCFATLCSMDRLNKIWQSLLRHWWEQKILYKCKERPPTATDTWIAKNIANNTRLSKGTNFPRSALFLTMPMEWWNFCNGVVHPQSHSTPNSLCIDHLGAQLALWWSQHSDCFWGLVTNSNRCATASCIDRHSMPQSGKLLPCLRYIHYCCLYHYQLAF